MGKRKDDDDEILNIKDIRGDDKKLNRAGKGWDQDRDDPAIDLLLGVREETQEED